MNREFLTVSGTATAATSPAARGAPVPVPASAPAQPPSHPLAGAFPAWDLVPAGSFVRRAK